MSIDEVDPATATGEVAEHLAVEEASRGFVPGYAHCFVPRPDVARAYLSRTRSPPVLVHHSAGLHSFPYHGGLTSEDRGTKASPGTASGT